MYTTCFLVGQVVLSCVDDSIHSLHPDIDILSKFVNFSLEWFGQSFLQPCQKSLDLIIVDRKQDWHDTTDQFYVRFCAAFKWVS